MLTSSESEFDEVMAMNLGADDYVTSPIGPPCCSRICRRCYGAARALLPV